MVSIAILAPITTVYAEINPSISRDTLPEEMKKVSDDSTVETDEFSDMEQELEELDDDSKGSDTTKIRIGKMKIEVVDDGEDITINKDSDWEDDDDDWDNDNDWSWNDDDSWTFHKKKNKDKNKFEPHWASFSMGLNNFVTVDGETTMPEDWQLLEVNTNNSLEINVNFAQIGVNLIKQRVGLVTGVGFRWNNYKFRNPNTKLSSETGVLTVINDSLYNGKMSKLTTWYLTIPLLLEIQIPSGGEDFYLSAGVEGGLKLSSYTKRKSNDKKKDKDRSDFFTTSLDYRLAARLGYGDFGIYGAYSMMPLFEKDKAIELYPVAVGITFNF